MQVCTLQENIQWGRSWATVSSPWIQVQHHHTSAALFSVTSLHSRDEPPNPRFYLSKVQKAEADPFFQKHPDRESLLGESSRGQTVNHCPSPSLFLAVANEANLGLLLFIGDYVYSKNSGEYSSGMHIIISKMNFETRDSLKTKKYNTDEKNGNNSLRSEK